jgi:Protein of unknown function (DUF3054)
MRMTAAVVDGCLVLVFVVIGRASHGEADGLPGLVTTAWPFVAGMGIGELTTRSWHRPVALVPTGIGVWLSTVVIGMSLRILAGQGIAMVFIAVALAFLGLFLLGWRVIVVLVPALRKRFSSPAS